MELFWSIIIAFAHTAVCNNGEIFIGKHIHLLLTWSACGILFQLQDTQSWFKGYRFCTGITTSRLGGIHMYEYSNWITSRRPNLIRLRKTVYSETEQESLHIKTSQIQLVQKFQDITRQSRLQDTRYWSIFVHCKWYDYLDLRWWL